MSVTQADIRALIHQWLLWNNDPNLWCEKDAEGKLITTPTKQYIFKDFKGDLVPWSPLTEKEVFVYLYCYHDENQSIKDCYEEWHISELTDIAIIIRDTQSLTPDTVLTAIPLSRIAEIGLGA
jgi:hypothetical protein